MIYSKTVFVTFNFQYIINDIGDIGDEQIIMFEEAGGVGAEEVVSSNEYDLCFVDTAAEVSRKVCDNPLFLILKRRDPGFIN